MEGVREGKLVGCEEWGKERVEVGYRPLCKSVGTDKINLGMLTFLLRLCFYPF